jgi:hypothetical protein
MALSALVSAAAVTGAAAAVVPGASASVYSLAVPPTARFAWFPSSPRVGERVTLISTSSDLVSPIVGFAWDLSDNGPFGEFQAGGPSASASFTTPSSHTVRLRVTAADHLSSTAVETIQMGPPAAGVLRPFPTVRISGRPVTSGVRINVLAVKAPVGATIKLGCRGRGCPAHAAQRRAAASGGHAVPTAFRGFERYLRAGVTLEIRISKGASIGAYTRFAVRRGRLPLRVDSCLDPRGVRPIACPSA